MAIDLDQVVDEWAAELPPYIFRKKVPWFLGGAITCKNLANLDSAGDGPPDSCKIRIGREMAYKTRELLRWLLETRGCARLQRVEALGGTVSATGRSC